MFIDSPGVPDQLRHELLPHTHHIISSLSCSKSEVKKLLIGLKVSKAHGRTCTFALQGISGSLTDLFNYSPQQCTLPVEWKSAHITPVFKKGHKELVKDYRPISLKSLIVKTLERPIYNYIFDFVESNNLLSNYQYGFRPG